MERLIDPMLADLQVEYGDAVRRGRMWRSRWVRVAGFITFVKVIALYGCERAILDWTADDHRALRRTIALTIAIIVAATLLLLVPPLLNVPSWTRASRPSLLVYVIPQAIPIAVPVGLTLGILYGLKGVVSHRLTGLLAAIAIILSVGSFAMMAWIIPAANQAYRVSVAGSHVRMGVNELTLDELRQLLKPGTHEPIALLPPTNLRYLAVNYQIRWALPGATFVLSLFALSLGTRRPIGRLAPGVVACSAYFGYYFLLLAGAEAGRQGALLPFAAAWLPNVVVVAVSAALLKLTSQQSRAARRA